MARVFKLCLIVALASAVWTVAAVELKDSDGRTELYRAVEASDAQVVKLLLGKGADPNARVDYPRHFFSLHGSSPHTNPQNHKTALMVAAERGDLEITRMLLVAGAEPNRKTRIDRTALLYAAEGGHLQVMSLLIAAKADLGAFANESENCCGGDLSGSALRFALLYAIRNKKDTKPALVILDHLKPGQLTQREADRCLNFALQRGMPELAGRIEALGADRRRINLFATP
jgi:ankyrin repeat protein